MRHVQYSGTVTGPLVEDFVLSMSLLDLSLSMWETLLFSLSVTCEQRLLFFLETLEPLQAHSIPIYFHLKVFNFILSLS